MPLTVNGFGTAYFGRKDEDKKGIYVTTKFVVALYVPIFPLASFGVMPRGAPVTTAVIRIQEFDAVEIPLDWQQVLSIYFKWYVGIAFALTFLFFVVGVFIEYRNMSDGKRYTYSQPKITRSVAAYLLGLSESKGAKNPPNNQQQSGPGSQ